MSWTRDLNTVSRKHLYLAYREVQKPYSTVMSPKPSTVKVTVVPYNMTYLQKAHREG